jgi:hypothetical protein
MRSLFSSLRGKTPAPENRQPAHGEEMLVVDARAHLTPAQMVERKLIGLMKAALLPVSSMHSTSRLLRR